MLCCFYYFTINNFVKYFTCVFCFDFKLYVHIELEAKFGQEYWNYDNWNNCEYVQVYRISLENPCGFLVMLFFLNINCFMFYFDFKLYMHMEVEATFG